MKTKGLIYNILVSLIIITGMSCQQALLPQQNKIESAPLAANFGRLVFEHNRNRTVLPDLSDFDSFTVSASSRNGFAAKTATSSATLTLDLEAGFWDITVSANRGGAVVATGTLENREIKALVTNSFNVPLLFSKGSGNGKLSIKIRWPKATGIDYLAVTIENQDNPVVETLAGDAAFYEVRIKNDQLAAGTHDLFLTFKRGGAGGTPAGVFVETVNIWSGLTSNKWIKKDKSLSDYRQFESDEFASPRASLSNLEMVGLGSVLNPQFDPLTLNYNLTLPPNNSISYNVRASLGQPGQKLDWRLVNSDTANPDWKPCVNNTTGLFNLVAGDNRLEVRVTAPDTATTNIYRITMPGGMVQVGNVIREKGTPIGVVFWVNPEKSDNYKIVALRNVSTGGIAWSTTTDNNYDFQAKNSDTDGRQNHDAIKKSGKNYNVTNFPAMCSCEYWDASKNSVQIDSAPTGWYLPAKNELRALLGVLATVNSALDGVTGSETLAAYSYWSSSQFLTSSSSAVYAYLSPSTVIDSSATRTSATTCTARAIRNYGNPASSTALPLATPVVGHKPAGTLSTFDYDGTISWSPAFPNGRFGVDTSYTATVSLSAKNGYSFEGLAAGAFQVRDAVAATISNNTGESCTVQVQFLQTSIVPGAVIFDGDTALGVVFQVHPDNPSRYKIVALQNVPGDATGKVQWSTVNYSNFTSSLFDGAANLADIKAKATSNYKDTNFPAVYRCEYWNPAAPTQAATVATGWYLPARDELYALYLEKTAVNSAMQNLSDRGAVVLANDNYWTSSSRYLYQSSSYQYYYAWVQNFFSGQQSEQYRSNSFFARAIRVVGQVSQAAIPLASPTAGALPAASIAGVEYTGNVDWNSSDTTFVLGKPYTATITLTAKSGFTFAGLNYDFFTVEGAVSTSVISNSGNSCTVRAVFPATGQKVGNIIYDDSTAKAIGVVFWVDSDNPLRYKIVALKEIANTTWSLSTRYYDFKDKNSLKDGRLNHSAIRTACVENTGWTFSLTEFPAMYRCEYWDPASTTNPSTPALTATGWYLPAKDELLALYNARTTVNTALGGLEAAQATQLQSSIYWSSSQQDTRSDLACFLNLNNGTPSYTYRTTAYSVRAIRAYEPAADTAFSSSFIPLAAPGTDKTAQTSIDAFEYSGMVSWDRELSSDKFVFGRSYTATITLNAKPAYTFSGVSPAFFKVVGAVSTIITSTLNGGKTCTIRAEFPATPQVVGNIIYEGSPSTAIGVVFWVDPASTARYKIVALKDVGTSTCVWSSASRNYDFANDNSLDNGLINQEAIKTACTNNTWTYSTSFPAMYRCEYWDPALPAQAASVSTGWYLPAIRELNQLFLAKTVVNTELAKLTTVATQLKNDLYWSSTQFGDNNSQAWYQNFSAGSTSQSGATRTTAYYVRAVRAFGY